MSNLISKQEQGNSNFTRMIPATEWNRHHSWPPLGGLRYLIFNAQNNGFDTVVKRVGKRVLIDERAFFSWIASQNQSKGEV